MFLQNCTVADNVAAGGAGGFNGGSDGGGIYCSGAYDAFLSCCTISLNSAIPSVFPYSFSFSFNGEDYTIGNFSYGGEGNGGGIYISSSILGLQNTLVAGNSVSGEMFSLSVATGPDVYGNVMDDLGFNLIGEKDGSSGWVATDLTGSIKFPLDPQLGQLQDNGGPTFTMALPLSSAAVDQGDSSGLTTDQRGDLRPHDWPAILNAPGGDGSDIGAYELQPNAGGEYVVVHPPNRFFTVNWHNYAPPGVWDPTNSGVFGLQRLPVGSPFGTGKWTAFTGAVRYYNANNLFVASDPIVDGSGFLYRLYSPATNMLVIPPAATTSATSIMLSNAILNGTTTPYGFNTVCWFEYGTNGNYGMNTPTNSLTTVTNPVDVASVSQPTGGLNPATVYHYQEVVMDEDGTQLGGDQQFTTPGLMTNYIGNSLTVTNGAPDGGAPLVILGEYSPAGPLATASPATTLPAGTVLDVKFYGQNYNFTLYALSYLTNGLDTNEQIFQVVASQSFSGTNLAPGIQTLAVTNFPVYAGDLLAFAGTGPYYPQNPNDATNSDATYEDSSNPNSSTATPPGGPGTVFNTGVYSDTNAVYGYISDVFGNQGRTYGFGVDVSVR